MEQRIEEVLDKLRPFLINDGGNIEFVKYEDGIVYIKLLGSCKDCLMADNTIENMIQYTLSFEIPEVKKVINII